MKTLDKFLHDLPQALHRFCPKHSSLKFAFVFDGYLSFHHDNTTISYTEAELYEKYTSDEYQKRNMKHPFQSFVKDLICETQQKISIQEKSIRSKDFPNNIQTQPNVQDLPENEPEEEFIEEEEEDFEEENF